MTQREKLIEMLKGAEKKADEHIRENDHMDYIPSLEELLGVYADHLLANGVIVPPCRVGDVVYQVDAERIYELEVLDMFLHQNKPYYETESIDFDEYAIGKTVFLTREEAEKALGERSGQ